MSEMENECRDELTKDTEWCDPDKIDLGKGAVSESEPCPEPEKEEIDTCCCCTPEPCPIHLKGEMTFEAKGCDPHPCISSIPPNLGCIPVKVGVGEWDGGVPEWMHACTEGCDLEVLMAKDPFFKKFVMAQGASLLDLDTNTESTTSLSVMAGMTGRQINIREFMSLAVKMYETGRALSGGINPDTLSLGYIQAQDGSLALSLLSDGVAVGTGLALVTETDPTTGNITSVSLPVPT